MVTMYIDKETFNKAFKVYCDDLYSEELLIKSFIKILKELNIIYPLDILNDIK